MFWTALLRGVALLLAVLCTVGVLLWLAERRVNPDHFPPSPTRGIGNGVWMALVTMTTVGYGDRVPVTALGRILTGAWMLVAMLTASSLTAGIATALTLQHIQGTAIATPEHLRGQRVAVVSGTTGAIFADRNGARLMPAGNLNAAIKLVLEDHADAVVFDRPMLQYYLQQHPSTPLTLSERSWEVQGYGFAVPIGSPLAHRLDVALQRLKESGRLEALKRRWLGP